MKQNAKASAKPAPKRAPAKGTKSKRSAGRPTLRGDSVGSAALLEATCELLREIAPEKITLAEVARRCGVDRRLIRYYFHDRARLLRAALDSLSQRFQQSVQSVFSETDTPEDRLRKRFESFLEFQLKYPYFRRLMVDEIMPSDDPADQQLLFDISLRGVTNYQKILEDGQAGGLMRPVDPQLFYLCLIGMQEMATVGAAILRKLGHPAIDSPNYATTFSEFALDLMMNGLRPKEG